MPTRYPTSKRVSTTPAPESTASKAVKVRTTGKVLCVHATTAGAFVLSETATFLHADMVASSNEPLCVGLRGMVMRGVDVLHEAITTGVTEPPMPSVSQHTRSVTDTVNTTSPVPLLLGRPDSRVHDSKSSLRPVARNVCPNPITKTESE